MANSSYDNLEILFDEIKYFEGQDLIVANMDRYNMEDEYTRQELLELYLNEVYPDLLGIGEIDKSKVYEAGFKDEIGYDEIVAKLDEYETFPDVVYGNEEECSEIYCSAHWLAGVYISQGGLGKYAKSTSAFSALGAIEAVKEYNCLTDDLSDSYLLMDGEKTVAEAKAEAEAYYNEHYPILGRENEIENIVTNITAAKIIGTDYYAFRFTRTLSYNGIPFRDGEAQWGDELIFMAEGALCQSNTVDINLGPINDYTTPTTERLIEKAIPFQEVMDRVAYYLTGETKFQLVYGGLVYRVVSVNEEFLRLTPHWYFLAKNPNDDSLIHMYVDMETGQITG